ncbi:hypothetical protein FWF74_03665 [Candidatus Saccharibacteria bacterium]|nr:hypothetical protein [Candidatus Saccharibacteria bacterium]MCL1962872.1 hypothetical protein [Candidatus Saccharibacteria bacterium]
MSEKLQYGREHCTLTRVRKGQEARDAGVVAITAATRAAVVEMLGVQREEALAHNRDVITSDPTDYIDTELAKVQNRQKTLYEHGIILPNPGIFYNFNEADLSISALIDVIQRQNLLYDREEMFGFVNNLARRQNSMPTGGTLLIDKIPSVYQIKTQPDMAARIGIMGRKITAATNDFTAMQLGVVPSLHVYNQQYNSFPHVTRNHGVFTPDITADGNVACVGDWHSSGRVHLCAFHENSAISRTGAHIAVVEKS